MNRSSIVISACMLVFFIVFCRIVLVKLYVKYKNKKWFNSVQIGDRYIQNIREPNPFLKKWGRVIIILDKKIGTDGLMYIKYRYEYNDYEYIGRFRDMIDVEHFVPYTGQDKEQ